MEDDMMECLLALNLLFSPMTPVDEPQSTDYSCVSDCMAKGYMYGYCTRLCSY